MMPRIRVSPARSLVICGALLAALVVFDGAWHALMAQTPFGGPRPPAEPQAGGIVGWLLAKQSEFYRQMSSTIRAAKSDGSAVWGLLAISFAYGIFHAAGPGHGKAVIASYLVANQETARRGIVLSFASALMQSLVAVVIVGICAWLLNATAATMCSAEKVVEIGSYALIALLGARLVWTKGAALLRTLQLGRPALALAGHPHDHAHPGHDHFHGHAHDHGHHHHDHHDPHDHHGHEHHDHAHAADHAHDAHGHVHDAHGHVHDDHCGHSHGPEPAELSGPGGWRRGFQAVFASGCLLYTSDAADE